MPKEVDNGNYFNDDELACWLAFDQVGGIGLGVSKVRSLYERLESAGTAWRAPKTVLQHLKLMSDELIDRFIARREEVNPPALLEKVRSGNIRAYPIYHPFYPARLREIHDPPLILYVKGDLIPADLPCPLAIVGTRRPSAYGQRLAKEFASTLAAAGATIVSGMALGVDSLAHRGALEAGGRTVAVLASGPDYCYPSSNRPLYKMLTEGTQGCVVSEYFPGITPETWRFPARNRLISGMSQAVVVIEAGEQSGALITAQMAFEQNRDVFAIPGRLDNPMSVGTNNLIKKTTARLLTSCQELIKELGWAAATSAQSIPTMVELFGREKELYDLLSAEPVHFDLLCERTGMPTGELSASLTMLELAGIVTRHPGDWYSRL